MYLQDYGTLSCWAANEVGTQQHPCLFQVVLAGKSPVYPVINSSYIYF